MDFTYGDVMKSSFGIGLVLMILGMFALALQGLSYVVPGEELVSHLRPLVGGLLCALGLSLMLASKQDQR